MESNSNLEAIDRLLVSLEEARDHLTEDISQGLNTGDRLRDAIRAIANSSSGSWIGWHSRMYYEEYREPPVADGWDLEWGGIHGFSSNWREKSQKDIQQEIERQAGVSLAELASTADRVREKCQSLQQEVLTVLSPICDMAGLGKEANLLERIDGIEWIISPSDFIQAMAPRNVISRDSMAMSQGLQAPLHVNVEAAVVSNYATLAASRDFLRDAIRVGRQARIKLASMSPSEQRSAILVSESGSRLAEQLRRRSLTLFALAALLLCGGSIFFMERYVSNTFARATVIVAVALGVAGLYAFLVDRNHAGRALGVAGGIASAVAAVDSALKYL